MLTNGEAGIDCANCDHQLIVHDQDSFEKLSSRLEWINGDPKCPECGHLVWMEHYLD